MPDSLHPVNRLLYMFQRCVQKLLTLNLYCNCMTLTQHSFHCVCRVHFITAGKHLSLICCVTGVQHSVISICFVHEYAVQFNAQHILCGNLHKEDFVRTVSQEIFKQGFPVFQFFQNQVYMRGEGYSSF